MPGLSTRADVPRGKTELATRWELSLDDYVTSIDVARDGTWAAIGVGDGTLVGVDVATGDERFRVAAHEGGVLELSLAPDGTGLVSCGQERDAKIWGPDGKLRHVLPGGSSSWVEHVAWAPVGNRLATSAGRKIRAWTGSGEPLVEAEDLASTVSGLAWRADGTGLAATCYGGVHLLPFVPGARVRHLPWKGSLVSVAWSPDAKIVACGSQDCSVHFWRLSSGKDSQMSGYPSKPKALAWDAESKLLATGGDATVTVWDFRGRGPEGTHPLQLELHSALCTHLAFSSKGLLASGSQDASILLWAPRKGLQPTRHAFLEDEVTALRWLPDGTSLLAGDARGTVRLWSVS